MKKIMVFCLLSGLCFCDVSKTPDGAERTLGWKDSFEQESLVPMGWFVADGLKQGSETDWLSGESHSGRRSLGAESRKAQALWFSEKVAVRGDVSSIAEGWIKTWSGKSWLEVTYFDAKDYVVSSWKSPSVSGVKDWTYVAIDIPPLADRDQQKDSCLMQVTFWVQGGRAALDDVNFHSRPLLEMINGHFETPPDSRGRTAFWSEATDNEISSGERKGIHLTSDRMAYDGTRSLEVAVTGDWVAVSTIHYPVEPWMDRLELKATTRVQANAEAFLGIIWTDASQQVLDMKLSNPVNGMEWQTITTGALEPPQGTFAMRAILAVRKQASSNVNAATAWFDHVNVSVQEKPFVRVLVNQVGYEKHGPKSAVILTNFYPASKTKQRVEIVTEKGKRVWRMDIPCAGRIYGQKDTDWGWYFWRADFSSLEAEGQYRLRANFGNAHEMSYPFVIGNDLLFHETAESNVDFFFVQRCGFEVPGWFKACHLDDAKLPDGTHRDLTGGWHSAGDYNKLTWEYGDGGVLYALVNAAESSPNYFVQYDRDQDGTPDVLDEAWWGAKYLAKLQIPETGGLLNHIQQGPDRKTWMNWCPPDQTTDNVVGTADDPIVQEGEGHSPLAIGGWARLSNLLRARVVENNFLNHATRLWNHATTNGTLYSDPLLLISTIDLYHVTGSESYLTYCRQSAQELLNTGNPEGQLPGGYGNSGDIPAAALAYFALQFPNEPLTAQIRERLKKHLPFFLAEADNPLGLMRQMPGADGYFFDPSSALGCNYQFGCRAWSALMVYRVTRDRRAWEYAANQLNFILGLNPYNICMMEKIGSLNLPRYHHRYITIPGHERGAVPGAIPNGYVRDLGGNDRPGIDLTTVERLYPSYRTNEPWLVHNVFYLLAVTALHEVQKG